MSQTAYVFIVGGESPLILHPFDGKEVYGNAVQVPELTGRYATGPVPPSIDSIREHLHLAMEKGARRFFLDRGYYPRLALSAGTFIIVYLFLSIVVRDPIPLLDELLLGSLSAAAVYLSGERRALSSRAHLDSVLTLRRELDSMYFTESRVVDLFESWMEEVIDLGPAAIYKAPPSVEPFSAEEVSEASALCAYLAERFRRKTVVTDLYEAMQNGTPPGALLDRAERKLGRREVALALAYLRILPLVAIEKAGAE